MIDIETRQETRKLDLDGEILPDNHDIKLGKRYCLQINFPYIGKSILLINEHGEKINFSFFLPKRSQKFLILYYPNDFIYRLMIKGQDELQDELNLSDLQQKGQNIF